MAIRFDVDRDEADRYAGERAALWIDRIVLDMKKRARRKVRKRTGQTRDAISVVPAVRVGRRMRGILRCDSPIAVLEDRGSQRHIIAQRPGGPVLTFYWRKVGRVVHFARVKHPGTMGSGFLTDTLIEVGGSNGMRVTIRP